MVSQRCQWKKFEKRVIMHCCIFIMWTVNLHRSI